MKTQQSMPNGSDHLYAERSLGDEFHESVLPQITGLLSDAETVLRDEARLLEARIFDRVQRVEKKLVMSILGVGSLILALGLFIITLVYEVTASFPSVPIWAVTGTLSVVTCILGGFLLTGTTSSRISEGD